MKLLILGANGMIGHSVLQVLSRYPQYQVFGTIRNADAIGLFSQSIGKQLLSGIDLQCEQDLIRALEQSQAEVIINCAGLTKHKTGAEDPMISLPVNSLAPHRLAVLSQLTDARLIHISTDCVFAGERGNYREDDPSDATDVYGRSKALGELHYPHTVTLRTSTIGPELGTRYGLLEWFLAQQRQCYGYRRAIFSGLPTVIFAELIADLVIPNPELRGLYHVAAKPIAKFELLQLIAKVYGKSIEILPDDKLVIDRSLDASRFRQATGWVAAEWPELIQSMFEYE